MRQILIALIVYSLVFTPTHFAFAGEGTFVSKTIGVITSIFTKSRAVDKTNLDSQMESALIDVVPGFQGVEEFLINTPVGGLDIFANTDSQGLVKMASKGVEFRTAFFSRLEERYPNLSSKLAILLDPESELVRDIEILAFLMQRTNEVPLTEYEMRTVAMEQVKKMYNLPVNWTYTDLEREASINFRYTIAVSVFNRVYFKLQEESKAKRSLDENIDFFKKKFSEKIFKLQIEHAKNTFSAVFPLTKNTIKFLVEGQVEELTFQDLSGLDYSLKLKVEDRKKSAKVGVIRPGDKHQDGVLWWISQKVGFKDFKAGRDFYRAPEYHPQVSSYLIEVKLPSGRVAEISSKDFSKIMNAATPNEGRDLYSGDPLEKRFFSEASKRNQNLSSIVTFVQDFRDADFEVFLERALARRASFNGEIFDHTSRSLSDLLRLESIRQPIDDVDMPAQILWAGYSLHPNYWKLRDELAADMGRPEVSNVLEEQEDVEQTTGDTELLTKDELKKIKKEKRAEDTRLNGLSKKQTRMNKYRFRSGRGRGLLRASVVAGVVSLVVMSIPTTVYTVAQAKQLIETGEISAPDMSFVKEFMPDLSFIRDLIPEWMKLDGGRGTPDKLRMDKDLDSYIVPGGEGRNGSAKSLFTIEGAASVNNSPSFYALVDYYNLPSEMREYQKRESDYVSMGLIREHNLDPMDQNYDIKAVSNISLVTKDGRLPILTPDNYNVEGLVISDASSGELLREGRDYDVYEIVENGLFYAKFNVRYFEYSDLTYEVTYEADAVAETSSSLMSMDKTALRIEVDRLRAAGMIELADGLDGVINAKTQVSVHEVEQAFFSFSTYTYQEEQSVNRDVEEPYGYFTRFLHGGKLMYQCSGSNHLMVTFLENYFARIGSDHISHAIGGFVPTRSSKTTHELISTRGHRTTAIGYSKGSGDGSVIYLDATPRKMDPKATGRENELPSELIKESKAPLRDPVPIDSGREIEVVGVLSRKFEIPQVVEEEVSEDTAVEEEEESTYAYKHLESQVSSLRRLNRNFKDAVATFLEDAEAEFSISNELIFFKLINISEDLIENFEKEKEFRRVDLLVGVYKELNPRMTQESAAKLIEKEIENNGYTQTFQKLISLIAERVRKEISQSNDWEETELYLEGLFINDIGAKGIIESYLRAFSQSSWMHPVTIKNTCSQILNLGGK